MVPSVHCAFPTISCSSHIYMGHTVSNTSMLHKHPLTRVGQEHQGTRETTLSTFLQLSFREGGQTPLQVTKYRRLARQIRKTPNNFRQRDGRSGSWGTEWGWVTGVSRQVSNEARMWGQNGNQVRLGYNKPFLHGPPPLLGEQRSINKSLKPKEKIDSCYLARPTTIFRGS